MVIERAPLEDELGDVLEKALRRSGLTEQALAARTGIEVGRIRDVIDYRGSLDAEETGRIGRELGLNVAGVLAVGGGRYPLPEIRGLPFCLYPLRMRHGIGVANAYVAADCASESGILFDCGGEPDALLRVWPARITGIEAVFLTHHETEHVGGLPGVRRRFGGVPVFGPDGERRPAGQVVLKDRAELTFGGLQVQVWSTPGHVEHHHCYRVTVEGARARAPLLVCGDLLFAGSIGGGYHCPRQLAASLRRLFDGLPGDTVLAPGHGPLTTIKNERAFNPFVV